MPAPENNDNPDSLSSPDIFPGVTIDNYKIIRSIGAGGMSEIYLAQDIKLNRLVALKFLPSVDAQDKANRERLIQEARAASRLNHPGIIAIHAIGQFNSRDFMVMEYVDGQSLRLVIDAGKIPIGKIIDYITQIGAAIDAAHKAGIVHRDLKSDNILLDKQDRIRICDFGLAYNRDAADFDDSSIASGSLAYMSPEQVQGDQLDQRTDLFSLGVILYELITGRLPFRGDYEASIIFAIVNSDPEPPSKYRNDMPTGLDNIISRLLAKNRDLRYPSAEMFLADLRQLGRAEKPDPKKSGLLRKTAYLLLMALAVIVLTLTIYKNAERQPELQMLVVLPFANLSPAENDYLSLGVTDAITTTLAKYGDLGVISGTSARQYKDTNKNVKQIARELNVDYILEGSVSWDTVDNRIRFKINCQLIRAREDVHLWAETYQPEAGSLIDTQYEIAERVARDIAGSFLKLRRPSGHFTSDPRAYDYYLQGNYYYHRSWGEADYLKAIRLYLSAIELDSGFIMPLVMLSRVNGSMYTDQYDRSDQRLALSLQAANRALEIDPHSPDAKLALGMYYYTSMQFGLAMNLFEEIKPNQPNNPELYGAIAAVQRRQGNFIAALENFKHAGILEPTSPLRTFDIGMTLGLLRKYADAEKYMDMAITRSPDWPLPYIYKAWIQIFAAGDKEKARDILREATLKADLSHTEYYQFYWWLSSIIDKNLNETISKINLASDTVSYYLYRARVYGFMRNSELEHAYLDSCRLFLEPLAARIENPSIYSSLGLAYAGLGRPADAIRCGEKGVAILPLSKDAYDGQFLIVNLAQIYLQTGRYGDAIGQLEILLSNPGYTSTAYLTADPAWSKLWDMPEFKKMLRKYEQE